MDLITLSEWKLREIRNYKPKNVTDSLIKSNVEIIVAQRLKDLMYKVWKE